MYDYDACFIYAAETYGFVEDTLSRYLVDTAHLNVVLHRWNQESVDVFLAEIRQALDRSAACVVFCDRQLSSEWYATYLQQELEERLAERTLRLIFVSMPECEETPHVVTATVLQNSSFQELVPELEATIVGYQPSKRSYGTASPYDPDLAKESTISGVFVPPVNFEMRPELLTLQVFWADPSRFGVLALVGLGGSGKTTLLLRFLQELPQSSLTDYSLTQQSHLPPAQGLFLWSFYDVPNIEYFIRGLYEYLTEELTTDRARDVVYRLIRHIENMPPQPILVVLDGLEIVQNDFPEDIEPTNHQPPQTFGLLRDSSLRHFVRRIAQGDVPMKVIITSRYPLPELQPFASSGYWMIETDQLDVGSAIGLLRSHQIQGTDEDLQQILTDYGCHALTLNLLGSLLHTFFNGDAQAAHQLPAVETGNAEIQVHRLARVLSFYATNLPLKELSILRLLSLLRQTIPFALLTAFYESGDRPNLEEFPQLPAVELRQLLAQLNKRGLIAFCGNNGDTVCVMHPAIRDYFATTVTQTHAIHEPIQTHFFKLSLARSRLDAAYREFFLQMGARAIPQFIKMPMIPLQSRELDIYEQFLYHAASSGDGQRAVGLYGQWGGYQHLAWELGDYHRGLRITSYLMEALDNGYVDYQIAPLHDHSLFLLDLGHPATAERNIRAVLSHCRQLAEEYRPPGPSGDGAFNIFLDYWRSPEGYVMYEGMLLQALCDALLVQGKLLEAHNLMNEALGVERQWASRAPTGSNPYGRRALARSLLGEVEEALEDFRAADNLIPESSWMSPALRDWYHIFFEVMLLARLGRLRAARKRLNSLHYPQLEAHRPVAMAQFNLVAAEIAYRQRDRDGAIAHLERTLAWAMQSGHQHLYIQSLLLQVRVQGQRNQDTQAIEKLDEVEAIARSQQFNLQLIDSLVLQGHLRLQNQEIEQAETCATEALTLSQNLSYRWGEGDAAYLLAKCYTQQGRYPLARELAEQALNVRRAIQDPRASYAQSLIATVMER